MGYQSLADYQQGWIFRHKDLPISPEDLVEIKPLDEVSAQQFWRQKVSHEATHASHFLGDDWPEKNNVWSEKGEWQASWDAEAVCFPELMGQHCQWPGNTVVYFCYDHERIIQTTWSIFQRCWKNFLFYDDEPLLLAKRRNEVVRFHADGSFHVGNIPAA